MSKTIDYIVLALLVAVSAYAYGYWYEAQAQAMSKIDYVQLCDQEGCYLVPSVAGYKGEGDYQIN